MSSRSYNTRKQGKKKYVEASSSSSTSSDEEDDDHKMKEDKNSSIKNSENSSKRMKMSTTSNTVGPTLTLTTEVARSLEIPREAMATQAFIAAQSMVAGVSRQELATAILELEEKQEGVPIRTKTKKICKPQSKAPLLSPDNIQEMLQFKKGYAHKFQNDHGVPYIFPMGQRMGLLCTCLNLFLQPSGQIYRNHI